MRGSPQLSIPQINGGNDYSTNYTGTSPAAHPIGAFPQTYDGVFYSNNMLANIFLLQMQQSDREQQIRDEERRRQSHREQQIREEERRTREEERRRQSHWEQQIREEERRIREEERTRFQRNAYVHSFIQEMLRRNNYRN
jgi:hypothetical protein